MKSGKSTFYAILLWGVVIYAIALLIYCTLRNYSADSKDFIADFGSIIGGIGTFFAAFIAAYLFNDWKEEKEYELVKESSLSLLEATLNLNSTIENFLAVIFEFRTFNNQSEFEEYTKWCDQFSKDFMQNIISIKTQNNKHHGLVLDFENDDKLFLPEDLQLAADVINEINNNFKITFDNYNNHTNTPLNPIDLNKYSAMIRNKIKYLNKKCKPINYNI